MKLLQMSQINGTCEISACTSVVVQISMQQREKMSAGKLTYKFIRRSSSRFAERLDFAAIVDTRLCIFIGGFVIF